MIFLLEIDPDSNLRHEWEILRESIHEKEVVTPIDNTLSLFKYKSKGNKEKTKRRCSAWPSSK